MMKKHIWTLWGLLILTIALTGCGLERAEETEALEPLNVADWPPPPPANTPVVQTPFPQITLAPTVAPTARPAATAPPTPATAAEPGPSLNIEAVTEQLGGILLDRLPPVAAVAVVTSDGATMRQGPGASYSAAGTLDRGELAGVLGKNPGGDWLYTVNFSLLRGWLPVDALRVIGALEEAPVLPPDPIAAALAQAISSGSSSDASAGSAASRQTLAMAGLKPIATARVDNAVLNMRQRPGAAFKLLDTLSGDDEVTVLALNRDKEWVLVETAGKKLGWVSLDFLDVEGSLANAPQVLTLTPGADHPLDQPAPIIALSGTMATTTEVSNTQAGSGVRPSPSSGPATTTQGNPLPPFGNLEPVAMGRINRDEVEIRPGPSTEFAPIDTLTDDQEEISVLALDKSRKWVLVNPAFSETGWISVDDLAVEGSLAGAPQIFTAWVESNAVQVRRGPGIFHNVIGVLSINSLISVLGLDEGRSWALVKPITGGGVGWVSTQFLNVAGRLADIPKAPELPLPNQNVSPGQAATPPPVPARPVSESKIVFQRSSGGDIMVINPDGSGLRRLSYGIDPVLSPDGQTAAFTRWQGDVGSLWLIDLDGTNERSILGFTRKAKGPEWSPDGSQIVINFQHGGRIEAKNMCTDLTQSNPRSPPRNASRIRVVIDDDGEPELCWQLPPDPHWQLRVVNVAGGNFEDVDGGTYAFRPAWDPGQPWRIVSDGGRGLLEVDLNGDHRQKLTDNTFDGSAVFSPDGRYLAVSSGRPGGGSNYDIYRLNGDGSGRIRLTQTPLWVSALPDGQEPWNNVSPAWSPDGSQIAFLTNRTGRWEMWVMKADGSDQHPLFSDAVNDQLQITYNFVDERVLSWR